MRTDVDIVGNSNLRYLALELSGIAYLRFKIGIIEFVIRNTVQDIYY